MLLEQVTTGGKITVLKQEQKMWFYAGVLQEGIKIVLDRLGRTDEAREAFERALELARSERERRFLERRIAEL